MVHLVSNVGVYCADTHKTLSLSQVSTAEDNGILLYNGVNDHIAVQLHEGHVKVTYDAGSQSGSTIYRCNKDQAHVLI